MRRIASIGVLTLLALGVLAISPARAGGDEDLRQTVENLSKQVKALEAHQATQLQAEINAYLEHDLAFAGAQGGDALKGVKISSRLTAVGQSTIGNDPNDRAVVTGDVDLDFDFTVTENLDLFVYLNAATDPRFHGFEADFGADEHGAFGDDFFNFSFSPSELTGGIGLPGSGAFSYPPIGGLTLAGLTDGVGVNGTQSVAMGFTDGVKVREAGITHRLAAGDNWIHWQIGALDPRTRFLQNAFAGDENTQFINDNFNNSPSILWLTDASGRTSLGWYGWISFGGNKEFTLSWGWFNTPGQWFNQGQLYVQIGWKGQVNGREMNVRLMGFIDEFFVDGAGDGGSGGGASWDWWVTDNIGVFFKFAANGNDVNPVDMDFSLGAQFSGLIGSRPDDKIGVAIAFASTNANVVTFPQDTEFTVEVYYDYVAENGKMHITPHVMYISNQGGTLGWANDSLFILGLRLHVPF